MLLHFFKGVTMKRKHMVFLSSSILMITMLTFTSCGQTAAPSYTLTPTDVPANIQPQEQLDPISSLQARTIAEELIGHGQAVDVILFSSNNILTYEVNVAYQNFIYSVQINAENGNIIGMERFEVQSQVVTLPSEAYQPTTPQESPPAALPQASPSPSPAASPSPYTNISLQQAISIAYADLAQRGISASYHANSGISWEYGQQVWELEFRTASHIIEFYVNVYNGNIVKFEMEIND